MFIYEQKKQLYRDYCTELNLYRDDFISESQADNMSDYYINSDNVKWINIFCDKDLAGFLIIGKKIPDRDENADYTIAEAYIAPEYRRQGLMRKAVLDYMGRHSGIWSLSVLKRNSYAIRYWWDLLLEEHLKPEHSWYTEDNETLMIILWKKEETA